MDRQTKFAENVYDYQSISGTEISRMLQASVQQQATLFRWITYLGTKHILLPGRLRNFLPPFFSISTLHDLNEDLGSLPNKSERSTFPQKPFATRHDCITFENNRHVEQDWIGLPFWATAFVLFFLLFLAAH